MNAKRTNCMYGQTMNNDVTLTGGENPLLAGRYQVVRQLGTGGMGSVWLAEDRQLDNKLFAVKMLPSILVANKRAYRQLKDEALVAMKLVHPNIVQIRAFEENNGNPFLVMDYIEGQTLDDYLADKGKLTEDETVRLLKPIATALDYAHGQGVIHRDVKPANVMIRRNDGQTFILDFGIAREIQETMTRVTGKLSSGTLLYMSPEQLRGQPPNAAQDVYSFAAMVYECLKGEPPFSRGQIEYQILNEQPERLSDDIRISASIMRGLSKTPEARPDSCVKVLLTPCPIRQMPAARPQVSVSPRLVAPMTDRIVVRPKRSIARLVVPIICLVIVILAVGEVLWHRQVQQQETARKLAIEQQHNELLRQQAEDKRRSQEDAERKKLEAERIAKEHEEAEARRKAEDAKQREEEAKARERELARQKEEEGSRKKMEEERSARDGAPNEMQVQDIIFLPFNQDPNYERCSDVVFAPVYFPKDRQLATSERPKINVVAQHLLKNPGRVVIVTGHCDEGVSNEFGLSVGEHYACIIRDNLVLAGVDGQRIQTRSYGAEKPAVIGNNERAFAMNNRGEFEIFRHKTNQQAVDNKTDAVNESTSPVEFRTVTVSPKIRSIDKHSSDGDFAELAPADMMYLLFQASARNDVALVAKVACTETFKLLTEEKLKNDYQQFKPESQDIRIFMGEVLKVATIRQHIVDESNAKVEIVASKENVERVMRSFRDRNKEKPSELRMIVGCKKMDGRWRVAAFPD